MIVTIRDRSNYTYPTIGNAPECRIQMSMTPSLLIEADPLAKWGCVFRISSRSPSSLPGVEADTSRPKTRPSNDSSAAEELLEGCR